MSLFDFVLRALDLEFHLSRNEPPQVPQELFVLNIGEPSINQGELRRTGDGRRRGRRARGTERGCGNTGEWERQGKEGRIKIDVVNIEGTSRVLGALSASLNSVLAGLDNLRENSFSLG